MSEPTRDMSFVLADTITKLPPDSAGRVVVSASHGGLYPGYLAAKARLRAVILNDAGVGKDRAGIGGLGLLERLDVAAAAVSHLSCRIGDSGDMIGRGVISHANGPARACGVEAGLSCREAALRLARAQPSARNPEPIGEGRTELAEPAWRRRIVLVDSAAMVRPEDAGHIVVTASHGGLLGGVAATALQVDAFAAVFNDAGIGVDDAGLARLAPLDMRGMAAFTVAAASARIGEARSSFDDGVISAANASAMRRGAHVGRPARDILVQWAQAPG